MLSLLPLPADAYPQVFEWEHGAATYEDWFAHITRPNYLNYGVFRETEMVGYLGLEKTSQAVRFHVSTRRHQVKPSETRRLVIHTGIYLFQNGIERLETMPLLTNHPARRLAIACGMRLETVHIINHLAHACYTLMKDSYLQNPQRWEAD